MLIDRFHAVVVFGLGFDFSFRLVSSVPKNRDIRGLYCSSLIFPTPTTWPFCRPAEADRHLHVRAWLSLLLISVTMKTTKWKWCEKNWLIRKKTKKKKIHEKKQQIGRSNILWVSWFKNILSFLFFHFAWMTQTTIPFHYIIKHWMGKKANFSPFFKTKLFFLKDFSNNGRSIILLKANFFLESNF